MTDDPQVFRTGSSTGYLVGAGFIVAALWVALAFLNTDALREEDRVAMAAIAVVTLLPIGLHSILRAALSSVILERDRLCVRDWTGSSRCVQLDRVRQLTWSYRYAVSVPGREGRGRACLELGILDDISRPRTVVIDYAGRERHDAMGRLAREIAERAHLRWASGDSIDAVGGDAGDVTWEAVGGGPARRDAGHGLRAESVFAGAAGVAAPAMSCVLLPATIFVLGTVGLVYAIFEESFVPAMPALLTVLVVAAVALGAGSITTCSAAIAGYGLPTRAFASPTSWAASVSYSGSG